MPCPVAGALARQSDRLERCHDDPGPFRTPPPPPGPALPASTPGRAHRRDTALRTWRRKPYPASRGRREAPFVAARSRPTGPYRRARKALAAWEDTRIAPECLPGIV